MRLNRPEKVGFYETPEDIATLVNFENLRSLKLEAKERYTYIKISYIKFCRISRNLSDLQCLSEVLSNLVLLEKLDLTLNNKKM